MVIYSRKGAHKRYCEITQNAYVTYAIRARACYVGSIIMGVEVAVFQYKEVLIRNNESTLIA